MREWRKLRKRKTKNEKTTKQNCNVNEKSRIEQKAITKSLEVNRRGENESTKVKVNEGVEVGV